MVDSLRGSLCLPTDWLIFLFPVHLSHSGSCSLARFGIWVPPLDLAVHSRHWLVSCVLDAFGAWGTPLSHPATLKPTFPSFSHTSCPWDPHLRTRSVWWLLLCRESLIPSLSQRSRGGSSEPWDYKEVGLKQNNLELFFLLKANYWGVFIHFLPWKLVFLWLMAEDWVIESMNSSPAVSGTWAGERIGFGTITDWTISVSLPQQDSMRSK